MQASNFYTQVYQVIQRIPPGKVSSYGRIAHMLGHPQAARAVGYALSALKETGRHEPYSAATVPWQRVVNSQGRISLHHREQTAQKQAQLLRDEGIEVDEQLRINLDAYLWEGLHLVELDDILNPR